MADDSLKKLLIKLDISTADWQNSVKAIKAQLKEIQDQALKDAADRMAAGAKELDQTKQKIADQKALQAQAEAMAAFDKAKAAWQSQQAAALRTKIEQTKLETEEAKKQGVAQANLVKQALDEVRVKQQQLKVQQQKTAEVEKQKQAEAKLPSATGVGQVRTTVAAASQSDVIQKIQTEALRQLVAEERARLAVNESQLRVLSQQEGVRKADVEVVQKEVAQERSKLALIENQLRMRELEEKQIRLQQDQAARIPSAAGVAGLRTSVQAASSVQVTKEQTVEMEKQLVQERARLSIQESQLRILSQQEGARKADIEVVAKEVEQERAKVSLIENQLRLRRLEEAQLREQQEQAARVPSTAGVAGLRTGVQAAASIQMTKEQTAELGKQIAEERAKLLVEEAQLKIMSQQEGIRKSDILVLEKEISQEKAKLALQEAQFRMSQAKHVEPGGEHEGGFFGGALLSLGGGLFGAGLPAMMTAGVSAGILLEKVLEGIGEKVRELGHEMLEAAGPAGSLQEQFNKLTETSGKIHPEEFLNKLRVATRGLVEDNTQLIKVANQFMSGPLKLEPEQIIKLTGLTVDLARATGGDATEAIHMLSRAAITGRTQMLGMGTGIDRAQIQATNLGKGIRGVAQEQLQLSMIMDAMTKRFAEVGTPMTTVKELFTQVHMVQGAFIEDMAYSLTHSKAFADGIQTVSAWLMKATPVVLEFAKSLGEKLGVAFAYLKPLLGQFWSGLSSGWTIVDQVTTSIGKLVSAMDKLGGSTDATSKKIGAFGKITHLMGEAFAPMILSLAQVASSLTLVNDLLDAATSRSLSKAEQAWKAAGERTKQNLKDFHDAFKSQKPVEEGTVEPPKGGPHVEVTQIDPNVLNQRRQLALQIATEQAKIRLETALQAIHDEEDAEKQKYEIGLQTLVQFLAKEKTLKQAELQDRLAEIRQEREAKLAALKLEQPGVKDPISGKIVGGMDAEVRRKKEQLINLQADDAAAKARAAAQKDDLARNQQLLQDQIAARRAYVSAINKIEQDGVKERIRLLDEEFKQGVGTADQYLAEKRALIEQEFNLREQSLAQEAEANKQNSTELAKIRIQFVEAEMDKEKQLQELEEHEGQIRLESIKTRYSQAREILEAEAEQARAQGPVGEGHGETAALEAEQRLTTAYLQRLQTEQNALEQSGRAYTSEWASINKEIYSAVQEQIKLNTELAKAKDIAGPLGQIFGTITSSFDAVLGTRAKGTLNTLAKSLEALSKVQTGVAAQTGGLGGLFKSTGRDFVDLFKKGSTKAPDKAIKSAQQIFEEGLKSATGRVSTFAEKAVNAADTIGKGFQSTNEKFAGTIDYVVARLNTFANAITNATPGRSQQAPEQSAESPGAAPTGPSGITGTVPGTQTATPTTGTGAVAGVTNDITNGLTTFGAALDKASEKGNNFAEKLQGFAQKAGDIIKGIGAVASSILGAKSTGGGILGGGLSGASFGLQVGGPMGAAIGLAVGASLGGLVGHKQQQLQQEVAGVNAHLQAIEDNLKNGTVSLGQSITQLEGLRSAAVGSLGGSKKGRKELPAVLQQINDELTNLLDQQKKTLDDLHVQLSTLEEPTAFQPIMDSLDQIVQKYQEYASAAVGNTQEVTNANLFLVASLKAYAQTLSTQVNSAEQQAIQNKLQLLDLQQQQFQLTAQYKQQIYDIQTAGVTTRQRTTAMSKGEQMAQAKYQYDLQNEQLQAEINTTQMKVNAEQTIFSLAQTRIGLEQQLLNAQTVQETLSVQNIQALQQTLNKLSTAFGPGGQIPAGLLNATGGVDIQAIEQLLGLPITSVSGAAPGQPTITNMPPIYQEFLDVFSKNPATAGFASQLLAAAQTPKGSQQRQALDDQLRNNPAYGQELVAAGVVSKPVGGKSFDPNWLNFFGWILNQATATTGGAVGGGTGGGAEPTVPTPGSTGGVSSGGPQRPTAPAMAVGGQVEETGAAVVHAGEGIFSVQAVPIFQEMINAMQQFSNTLLNFLPGMVGMSNQAIRPMAPITSPTTAAAGAPMLAVGGEISESGAAVVHKGEGIFSTQAVPIFQKMIDGMDKFGEVITKGILNIGRGLVPQPTAPVLQHGPKENPLGIGTTSTAALSMHKSIFDLSSARVSMESALLDKHKQVIALDMQRIQAIQSLAASGGGVTSLEGAFAKVYELRGRMGAGGFTKENL